MTLPMEIDMNRYSPHATVAAFGALAAASALLLGGCAVSYPPTPQTVLSQLPESPHHVPTPLTRQKNGAMMKSVARCCASRTRPCRPTRARGPGIRTRSRRCMVDTTADAGDPAGVSAADGAIQGTIRAGDAAHWTCRDRCQRTSDVRRYRRIPSNAGYRRHRRIPVSPPDQ